MATGSELMMDAAIKSICKIAGLDPATMRETFIATMRMVHETGARMLRIESGIGLIQHQNAAMQMTLDRMAKNTVTLEDDELLMRFPPGSQVSYVKNDASE